jgi:hypothetical protein
MGSSSPGARAGPPRPRRSSHAGRVTPRYGRPVADPDDDLLRDTAADLERAADELTRWVASMTEVRVALLVFVVGHGPLTAYELARAEAARLAGWDGLARVVLDADEPEPVADGALRVGVLVGPTALDPDAAVRGACAVLDDRGWSAPRSLSVAEHRGAYWEAAPLPERGVARIEVHAAPGLATAASARSVLE